MSLILGMLAVTATCVPNPATTRTNADTIRGFIGAINARDAAAMGSFVMPAATFTNAPGEKPMPLVEILTMLHAAEDPGTFEIIKVAETPNGARLNTRFGDVDAKAAFKIDGGCITAMDQGA